MKTKFSLVLISIFLIFLGYKYFDYKVKCDKLIQSSTKFKLEYSSFSYFFSTWFESKGELPKEENVIKYINKVRYDTKTKLNYVVKINHTDNSVEIIKKGNVFNKEPFRNLIKVNHVEDYLENFSFFNYLIYGDFNLLIYSNKFKYSCGKNNSGTHIFVTNENEFILTDSKLLNNLKNLLKAHNLELSRYEDEKVITILYNKGKITLKCKDQEENLPDGVLDTIKSLLESNFPSYPSIKFSLRY